MRAIVAHAAKDLRIEERQVDNLESGHLRVQVDHGGICGSDLHYYNPVSYTHLTLPTIYSV